MLNYEELTRITESKIRRNLENATTAKSFDSYFQWKAFVDGAHALWLALAVECSDVTVEAFSSDCDRLNVLFEGLSWKGGV